MNCKLEILGRELMAGTSIPSFVHQVPVIQACSLSLQYANLIPASEELHTLYLECSSQIISWLHFSFQSDLYLKWEVFLDCHF